MDGVWTKERIWDWYHDRPWIRGCNYIPANCCNRIEMWQKLNFPDHLAKAEEELALAETIGFNSIRVILEFLVWKEEHDSFFDRFEQYLEVCDAHGITLCVCFGNDCTVPLDDNYRRPHLGPQTYDLGYHGGLKNSPHTGQTALMGYSILDDPETSPHFFEMVREVIARYRNDKRILIWDLFNEVGNGNRGTASVPHIIRMFQIAREVAPIQPLTSGVWSSYTGSWTPAEDVALENSDIITYHCYAGYDASIRAIDYLKQRYGRPMMNTEWLHRPLHNTVYEQFPLFYLEGIGCYNWGFAAGKTQTYELWDSLWIRYEKGNGRDLDFTKWQHDLFRPNLRPYDPGEIDLIQRYCKLADERFQSGKPIEA